MDKIRRKIESQDQNVMADLANMCDRESVPKSKDPPPLATLGDELRKAMSNK